MQANNVKAKIEKLAEVLEDTEIKDIETYKQKSKDYDLDLKNLFKFKREIDNKTKYFAMTCENLIFEISEIKRKMLIPLLQGGHLTKKQRELIQQYSDYSYAFKKLLKDLI